MIPQGFTHYAEVIPGLFIGDKLSSVGAVVSGGIRDVICIGNSATMFDYVNYLSVSNEDHNFNDCIEFISQRSKEEKPVLVMCSDGKSKSVVIVASYLMATFDMKAQESLDYVKTKWDRSNPLIEHKLQLISKKRASVNYQETSD